MKPDWDRIREHYRRNTLAIYNAGASDWGIDPYAWDHECDIQLTIIERMLWSDIRRVPAIFYPQYPVAGYFVDFANPVRRIGIECDGKAYHTDVRRDERRQHAIEDNGWIIYRISGADCMKDSEVIEDEYGRPKFHPSPAYEFVRGIAETHGLVYTPAQGSGQIVPAAQFFADFLAEAS